MFLLINPAMPFLPPITAAFPSYKSEKVSVRERECYLIQITLIYIHAVNGSNNNVSHSSRCP